MTFINRVGPGVQAVFARSTDVAEAVAQCTLQLGLVRPALILLFCGGRHDPYEALRALSRSFPGIPVAGGSAVGAISRTGSGYSGFEMGMVAFVDPGLAPQLCSASTLAGDLVGGSELGKKVAEMADPGAVVCLLYDSVRKRAQDAWPELHHASRIVEGFHSGLEGTRVCLFGAGLLTDLNLHDSWTFNGDTVRQHVATALVFPPRYCADAFVLSGCIPASSFLTVTEIEGAEVFALDGKPALDLLESMLHMTLSGNNNGRDISLAATLGKKLGDPFAPFREDAYVNRMILSTNRETRSLTLFETDFRKGDTVQIMARNNHMMLESVRRGVAAANQIIQQGNCLLALYIDCAGRASIRSGSEIEEADIVRAALDQRIPLCGFYSGVEIAPFDGAPRPLDWTGLLVLLRYA